jgi:hypothetical protein
MNWKQIYNHQQTYIEYVSELKMQRQNYKEKKTKGRGLRFDNFKV